MNKDLVSVDGVVMMKQIENEIHYMCFQCGKFYKEGIKDGQLQLFCSKECEKKSDEYWEKVIKDLDVL